MQGVAFMGAFFHAAPLMESHGLSRERLFEGIRKQLNKKFGHLGEQVVEDNVRVITRGFDEVQVLEPENYNDEGYDDVLPLIPPTSDGNVQRVIRCRPRSVWGLPGLGGAVSPWAKTR